MQSDDEPERNGPSALIMKSKKKIFLLRHLVVVSVWLLLLLSCCHRRTAGVEVIAFSPLASLPGRPTSTSTSSVRRITAATTSSSSSASSQTPPVNNENQGSSTLLRSSSSTSGSSSSSSLVPSSLPAVRPLQQHWWPVAALSSLDSSRPNEIQLLGLSLVAYRSSSSSSSSNDNDNDDVWTVLNDRCSHRFAPLSEGRVVIPSECSSSSSSGDGSNNDDNDKGRQQYRLQCAYHGWEFQNNGTCVHVPQQPLSTGKARPVTTYPTQVRAGLLWVWPDSNPHAWEQSQSIPLPINPLLDQWVDKFGPASVFQRDLPYGIEILGENLLDLSHLPYAHHSVGGLQRELGKELPTRMLSQQEKIDYAEWEQQQQQPGGNNNVGVEGVEPGPVVPTLQAEILQAANHDPIFKSFLRRAQQPPNNAPDWKTTVGFWSPNHVRYRRTRGSPDTAFHVELFLCPRTEGRSRVFLFNTAASLLRDPNQLPWKERLSLKVLTRLFDPRKVRGHLIGHSIFDGDGIFLHKQGNRMRQANVTYREYSTPSSADVLLNAYRRWMDRLAETTILQATSDSDADANTLARARAIAQAVVGTNAYGGDLERSVLLDRYNTHTKSCPTCKAALRSARRRRALWSTAQTALLGAAGASVAAWAVLLAIVPAAAATAASPASTAVRLAMWTKLLAVWATLAAYLTGRSVESTDQRIQQFLFEDYVHAEKA